MQVTLAAGYFSHLSRGVPVIKRVEPSLVCVSCMPLSGSCDEVICSTAFVAAEQACQEDLPLERDNLGRHAHAVPCPAAEAAAGDSTRSNSGGSSGAAAERTQSPEHPALRPQPAAVAQSPPAASAAEAAANAAGGGAAAPDETGAARGGIGAPADGSRPVPARPPAPQDMLPGGSAPAGAQAALEQAIADADEVGHRAGHVGIMTWPRD